MANKNKKFFLVFLPMVLACLPVGMAGLVLLAQPVLAVDFGLGQIGNIIGLGSDDPRVMTTKIINAALGFLGVLALGFILYGGFLWLTSGGDAEKINKAKKVLISAAIGLAIIFSAWGITLFILQKLGAATGININGDEGEGPPGGGPPGNALLVKSIMPQGPIQICNPVARIKFNKNIDPTTAEGNITISANGQSIAGTLKIDGVWVEFRPNSDCPEPDSDKKCWQTGSDPSTEYSIKVDSGVKGADDSALWCGAGYSCSGAFTILQGCFIDASSPTVRLTYPFSGQPICSDGTAVRALAKDDVGVGRVDFYVDNDYLASDEPEQSNMDIFEAEVWWETAGFTLYSPHKLKARAFDLDDNQSWSKEIEVKIFPAHCCNGLQDSGETGLDCGGECLACTGEDCDAGDDNLDTCVQPEHNQCLSQYCRSDNCTCLALPLITAVQPMDGALGNLITIWGNDFRSQPGKVVFLGDDENENCFGLVPSSVNSVCTDYWQNDQIIIVVPTCSQSGPIKVVTSAGLYDRTDDWRGPDLGDFEVNDIVRPGICSINPQQGRFQDPITLQGINFSAQAGYVWFGYPLGKNKVKAPVSSWSMITIGASVPNLKPATVSVYIQANNGEISNGINFKVSSTGQPGQGEGEGGDEGEGTGDEDEGGAGGGGEGQQCSYAWTFSVAERTLCDSDSASPGCQASQDLCAADEECREDCYCYPKEVDEDDEEEGEAEYCDADVNNPGCQAEPAMCSTTKPFCDQRTCECQPYQSCKYGWTFQTGSYFVKEECVDYNKDGAPSPSPTPWDKVSKDVCINVLVAARFSESVDEQSVKNGVKVQVDCSGAKSQSVCDDDYYKERGCYWSNSQCISQPLVGYVHVYNWDEENDYGAFEFHYGAQDEESPGVNYLKNTKYKVTLAGGPNGIKTTAGVPLIDDYVWSFETRDSDQLCELDKVKVVPFNAKLVMKDALQDYTGGITPKDDPCLLLNPDNYEWNWFSEDESKGKIDDQDENPKNSKSDVRAVGETTSPIKIFARIDSENKQGYGNLIIEFANFVLLKHWPCGDANNENVCPNALIGAEFNREVDESSFNDSNVKIFASVDNQNWNEIKNLPPPEFFLDKSTGHESVNVFLPNKALLNPSTYYRIIFKDDDLGIKNYLGEELDNPNYDMARGEECDDGNKISGDGCSGKCLLEGLKNPTTAYQCGNGLKDPGEDEGCDLLGGIYSGCNNSCLFKGSFSPAICGDAIVDKAHGEECDDGNQTSGDEDDCSNKCLNELGECEADSQGCSAQGVHLGTPPKATCGNGKIEIGEDCDDGNTASNDGCSGNCQNEGSTGWAVCGNGLVEGSELDSYSWVFKTKDSPELCQLASIEVKPKKTTAEVNQTVNYQAEAYGGADICEPKGQKLKPEDYLWGWWLDGNLGKATIDSSANNQAKILTIKETGDQPVKVSVSVKDKNNKNEKKDFGELFIVGQSIKGGELCKAKEPNYQYNPDTPAVCPVEVPDCGPPDIYQCLVGDTTGDVCKTYDDCPRCCCEPKKKYKNLTCEPDQDKCTGSIRGLYCGCQKDLDCAEVYGDKYGCGFSDPKNCCGTRPWIFYCQPTGEDKFVFPPTESYCKSDSKDFCPNGLIKVYFDQVIKPESLAGNFIVVIPKGPDDCPKGTEDKGEIELAFNDFEKKNFWSVLASGLNKLLGREAKAEMVEFCQVTGDIYAYQLSAKDETTEEVKYFTEAVFSPDETLAFNRTYYALVAGDDLSNNDLSVDLTDDEKEKKSKSKFYPAEGVVSVKGVGMNLNDTWVPAGQKSGNNFYWSFTTKADFCLIDKVNVYINGGQESAISDFFNCTKSNCPDDQSATKTGNQHHYRAEALDKDGQEVKADFEWTDMKDGEIVKVEEVDVNNPNQQLRYVTASPREDDQVYLLVSAEEGFAGSTAEQLIDIRVFDCANPWPTLPVDVYSWKPWQDKDTNFEFYYCRDKGAAGDDLPALNNPPVIINNLGKNVDILKEFLFAVLDNEGKITSDVVGFRVIKNAGRPQNVCSNNCQKSCGDDTECPGGYCLKQYAHLSPGLWYTFPCNVPDPGSPQALTVDGYKAVRDGRTTYVAAANYSPSVIYSNIYLASYNENAQSDTQTIYNQILGHWHFNTNLTNFGACYGADNELVELEEQAVPCQNDSICQELGGYCSADKSKITRDTVRLGDLNDIAHLLDTYYKKKEIKEGSGNYPALASGSYLKGLSTSKWPISWGATLKGELGKDLPLDPLNIFKLPCKQTVDNSSYEQSTCWSETKKNFYLPPYSKLYIYKYKEPAGYNLCAELEFTGDGFGLHNLTDQWFGLSDSDILPNSQFWNGNQLKFGLIQCYP